MSWLFHSFGVRTISFLVRSTIMSALRAFPEDSVFHYHWIVANLYNAEGV